MNLLQVSFADVAGGAEAVAWSLHHAYRRAGHAAWLAVGRKRSADPSVLVIPNATTGGLWRLIERRLSPLTGRVRGAGRLSVWLDDLARGAVLARWRGTEDFHFPGTAALLELPPVRPDVLHLHNLHGGHAGYFDLQYLPRLSAELPLVLTLHDGWLLSGHCAHSFGCERWRTGCGRCPDLSIPPAIRRDATAFNWQRKRDLYQRSRLYVATPSEWMMRRIEASMLAPGVVEARVIPNGVDLSVFRPGNRQPARAALGLPLDADLLLFTATDVRRNVWKDYATLRAAVARAAEQLPERRLLLLGLGESAHSEQVGRAEIRFVPFVADPLVVARYYAAADLYVHAAHVDTFPTTVLEALACGRPVVATGVGGVPEQVRSLDQADSPTGVLVPTQDASGLAAGIARLLTDEPTREWLGANAVTDARRRFDLDQQTRRYLDWYAELVENQRRQASTSPWRGSVLV